MFNENGFINKPEHKFKKNFTKVKEEKRIMNALEKAFLSMGRQLVGKGRLEENDHDYEIFDGGERVIVQLTNVFELGRVRDRKNHEVLESEEMYDDKLMECIKRKIGKNYVSLKKSKLWLVAYLDFKHKISSDISFSKTLGYINSLKENQNPFNEIWFFDLKSRPISVWKKD